MRIYYVRRLNHNVMNFLHIDYKGEGAYTHLRYATQFTDKSQFTIDPSTEEWVEFREVVPAKRKSTTITIL